MSGDCVEKIYHPDCGRHLVQVFENEDGTYSGYCYALQRYIPDPYSDKPRGYKPKFKKKTQQEIQEEIDEILGCPITELPERGLSEASNAYYEIRTGLSEEDGVTPKTRYYPYTKDGKVVAFKVRAIETKSMFVIGPISECDLFGWEAAVKSGGRKLFITEGEEDAAALYQICKTANAGTKYADSNPSIVSLPLGAASAAKSITKALPKIKNNFEEIVLCFDNDEAGRKAVEEVLKVVPNALVANLPGKDANECLLEGKIKQAYASIQFRASKPKNTRLVFGNSLHEAAKKPAEWGYSWPWEHITKLTRGIRLGETIYIGAGQKQGKSELVNSIAAHCMMEHGWKVFLVKPEEENKKTYKLVLGKMVGKQFNDPEVDFDEDAYDRAGEMVGDKLVLLNLYQHVGWDSLKEDIRVAASDGVKAVFIDPITNLVNGLSAAEQNTKLQEIAQELSAMALDLNIVIFIFCHLRNPENGIPHEMGGKVLSSQFAGSRAMARSCNLMLGLEGNRDPDLPEEERNIRHLVILENRENGEVGRFGLYWNKKTTLFTEIK